MYKRQGHQSTQVDRTWHNANSTPMHVRIQRLLMQDEQGGTKGVLQIGFNISKYQEDEEDLLKKYKSEQANSEQSRHFIDLFGSDCRTQLRSMVNTAQTSLERSDADTTHLKCVLHSLLARTQGIAHLLDGLLDAVRIEAGRIVANTSSVRIKSLLDRLTSSYVRMAASKKIDVVYQDTYFNKDIALDVPRLEQIFGVIIQELIGFLNGGVILVNACVSQKDSRQAYLRLSLQAEGKSADGLALSELLLYLTSDLPVFNHRMQGVGCLLYTSPSPRD